MELSVVIVAGGRGHRMGEDIPKQYLSLGDCPIILQTIKGIIYGLSFIPNVQIILVHPKGHEEYIHKLLAETFPEEQIITVTGGASRSESVCHGLEKVDTDYVMIHDGVRPFVSPNLLRRIWSSRVDNAVIPAISSTDSVRLLATNGDNSYYDRDRVMLVQTPQLFNTSLLKRCYKAFLNDPTDITFTDEASIVEHYGDQPITLAMGEERNIKITTPKDMVLGEWILKQMG